MHLSEGGLPSFGVSRNEFGGGRVKMGRCVLRGVISRRVSGDRRMNEKVCRRERAGSL